MTVPGERKLRGAGVAVVLAAIAMLAPSAHATRTTTVERAARAASAAYGVPAPLLMAIGYVNARWRMPPTAGPDGGFGLTHLVRGAQLREARRLTGLPEAALEHDAAANLRGGAALLADVAGRRPPGLAGWYAPLARLGGQAYADQVYSTLATGAAATVEGKRVVLRPVRAAASVALAHAAQAPPGAPPPDYARATWIAASKHNYTVADRPLSQPIQRIVIHVTDSSYGSAINWFQDPAARAAAHYVIRSSDGAIAQTVRERDVAWHAGNWRYNETSIGIEHEAIENDCSWYTEAMYRSSARLVAALALEYGIPVDRKHIIGHYQVPNPDHPGQFGGADGHTDPGPCWHWAHYIALVRADVGAASRRAPRFDEIVSAANTARVRFSANWAVAHAGRRERRAPYLEAQPPAAAPGALPAQAPPDDPAQFQLDVPRAGRYRVYLRWPSGRGRSSAAPVTIQTASGPATVNLDERSQGAAWTLVGTFVLPPGQGWDVSFSRLSLAPGSLVAQAVRIIRAPG